MANVLGSTKQFGSEKQYQLITVVKNEQRDFINNLVTLTASRSQTELLSLGLVKFLELKPWEKKGWVWEPSQSYWEGGRLNKRKACASEPASPRSGPARGARLRGPGQTGLRTIEV